jgi:anti-anti-sigma factor
VDTIEGDLEALLSVSVTADGPRSFRVAIGGELDIGNVDVLEREIAAVLQPRPDRLVLDVSALRFADSSGIALWLRLARCVDEFELRDPSPLLRRVLATMGLTSTLRVRP